MLPRYLIVLDTETSGLDPLRHSLLTVGLRAIYDDNGKLRLDEHEADFKVRRDPNAEVSERALEVNGINLEEHDADPSALSHAHAAEEFADILSSFRLQTGLDGVTQKPALLGHNVGFDIGFVKQVFPNLNDYIQYGPIDTKVIADFLITTGMIDCKSSKLVDVCPYFGISLPNAHNAAADAQATAELYISMVNMIRGYQ